MFIYKLVQLSENIVACLQVVARNGLQDSESSSVARLQFDGDAILGSLEGLRVTGHTNDSVSLQWQEVQGVEGYYVTPRAAGYAAMDTRLSATPSTTGETKQTAYLCDVVHAGLLYYITII